MIKIAANLSKKVMLPGTGNSDLFGGSIEIEIGPDDSADVINDRMRRLFSMLSRAVEAQIKLAQNPATGTSNGNGNGQHAVRPTTGNNRLPKATSAQQKAIFAICKAKGLDLSAVLSGLKVSSAAELTVADASKLIDQLKHGE